MNFSVFLFEFKHFYRTKSKLFSYIFFILLCVFSIISGFDIQQKQINTINDIKAKKKAEYNQIIKWLEQKSGPEDKSWVKLEDPYWSIRYTPSYLIKYPSALFPLGTGQSAQFGFYKKVNRWSSSYDEDLIGEISNYERLINGNIDFSFLIIFLLPILFIILTYNINGLEKDLNFYKLISVQNCRKGDWVISRILFYFLLLVFSINILIISVGLFSDFYNNFKNIFKIILISNLYLFSFAIIFFYVIQKAKSSSSTALKMISIWLLFCVIIPGSVHQYVSFKYPANYMTDFLDVNREQTYEVFKLDNVDLYDILMAIHPELFETKKGLQEVLDNKLIRRSISTIINQMNIDAANEIEIQNELKNSAIRLSYFFNPVSYVQNLWNACTQTDYYSYQNFRFKIEESITLRNKLMVLELWRESKVDKENYQKYLEVLNKF